MLRVSILIAAGVTGVLVGLLARPKKPARCFSIKRTKSELGYTFWILEGFGRHKCFILCDTWQEAIEEANRRLGAAPAAQKLDKQPFYADNGRRRPMPSHPMDAPVEPIAR